MVRRQQTELEIMFREELRREIGDQRYQLWFAAGVRFSFEGNLLTAKVDNPFMVTWLNSGYVHLFKKIGQKLFNQKIDVDVVVEESASPSSSGPRELPEPSPIEETDQNAENLEPSQGPSLFSSEDVDTAYAPSPYAQYDSRPYAELSQSSPAAAYPESEEPSEPPKRKRGRPRKNPVEHNAQYPAPAAPNAPYPTLAEPYAAPGAFESPQASAYYPPAYPTTDPYAVRSLSVPTAQPKRKRGRPRKNPVEQDERFPAPPTAAGQYPPQNYAAPQAAVVPPASALPPESFRDALRAESQARYQAAQTREFPNVAGTELSRSEREAYAAGTFDRGRFYPDQPLFGGTGLPGYEPEPQKRRGRPKNSVPRTPADDEEEIVSRDERGLNVVKRPKEPVRVKSDDRRAPFASLNTFVVGFSNQLARRVIDVALAEPFVMSPIFIYGPTSVGKTHLLEGVCDAYARMRNAKPPLYMTGLQFTEAFVHSLRGGTPFRDRFNNISLFALDDVHFLEGKSSTQVELLNLFDYLRMRRVQMVVSANRPLPELNGLRGELTTRLESGVICKIDPPERETLAVVLRNMALERRIVLSDDVCRFVVSRYANNARQLSGALNKLFAEHVTTGAPIDVAMAQRALADLGSVNFRNIKLEDVERVVQEIFGLESNALKSASRAKKCADPRAIAMWVARKHTRAALAEIGQFFGGRKHSAVLSAQKKVDEWLSNREPIDVGAGSFTVNEAVERVERALSYPKS